MLKVNLNDIEPGQKKKVICCYHRLYTANYLALQRFKPCLGYKVRDKLRLVRGVHILTIVTLFWIKNLEHKTKGVNSEAASLIRRCCLSINQWVKLSWALIRGQCTNLRNLSIVRKKGKADAHIPFHFGLWWGEVFAFVRHLVESGLGSLFFCYFPERQLCVWDCFKKRSVYERERECVCMG